MRTLRFSRPGTGGVALHAQLRGNPGAPCVVLLHGGGANLHWWDEIAPSLAERFRVVALDFRGHGDSDYPEQREVGAFHRDLESLLEELDAPRVALVGHSMGAHVALDHASRHASVWAVAAVEVSSGSSPRDQRRMRLALQLRREYTTFDEAVRRFRLLPRSRGVSEARRAELAAASIRELPGGHFAYKFDPHWFGMPAAPRGKLEDIACPCLVIRGSESPLLTREGAEQLVDRLPSARLLEVPGAGHNVHLEAPDRVGEAIREHLTRCAPVD